MILPITLTIAGIAAILNIWLGWRCGQVRTAEKILVGDGGSPRLIARMRAHANFVEYTPIVLILIAAIELADGSSLWLWAVGALYVAARVAHAIGMDGPLKARMVGTLVTMLTLLGLGLYAVALPLIAEGRVTTLDTVTVDLDEAQ